MLAQGPSFVPSLPALEGPLCVVVSLTMTHEFVFHLLPRLCFSLMFTDKIYIVNPMSQCLALSFMPDTYLVDV